MQFIRDEDIKTAFVTMMNKLIFGQKFILRPLLDGLRNQNNAVSFRRIEELETKIENNLEQSQMLTGLMARGYLEPVLFNKEKNSLEAERERLLAEKEQLTHSVNGNFVKVEEVDRLLKFSTTSKMFTAYEDELFEDYVERIVVFSREEVGFELKCGITLKERLEN
jgi:site-specific DNA recombinase